MFSAVLNKLHQIFGIKAPLNSAEALQQEKLLVDEEFKQHFDGQYENYLKTDFKHFLTKEYADQIKRYGFVKQENYPAKERPEYGLALSGGGIRSASFAIGVIQALASQYFFKDKPSIFSKFKYLSTVSGGGYTGAALSWFNRLYGVFPFGNIAKTTGTKTTPDEDSPNKILGHIRQHGKYLAPPELGLYGLVAFVLFAALHSLLAYTLIVSIVLLFGLNVVGSEFVSGLLSLQLEQQPFFETFLADVGNMVNRVEQESALSAYPLFSPLRQWFTLFFFDVFILSLVLFLVSLIFLGGISYFTIFYSRAYSFRLVVQKWLARLIKIASLSIMLILLPVVVSVLIGVQMDFDDRGSWGAGLSGVGGVVMAVLQFRQRSKNSKAESGPLLTIINLLIVSFIIIFLFSIAFALAEQIYTLGQTPEVYRAINIHPNWFVFVALVFVFIVNINQISLHKMYRDRLMDTFLKDPQVNAGEPLGKRGKNANKTCLQSLIKTGYWSPYPLINCNVILVNSPTPRYQGRLGDSFLLSPLFCGSDATRYCPTEQFALGTMTLATAMSISGAAANPHAAVAGSGVTSNPILSLLMTILGLRLGYWCHNPNNGWASLKPIMKPNYLFPGILSLLNLGYKESSLYVELTDGGHFDNSGLYELIRRRVPVIFLADGSEDAETKFEDLGHAIERVRVDFGVGIRFLDELLDLSGLIPGSQVLSAKEKGAAEQIFDSKYNLCERGYGIADIVYPDVPGNPAFIGKLVYIKASLTRNLPADLYAYKANNPSFPNQPTSDQFFDEKQFEAYRELGYQLTRELIHDEYAMDKLP